VSALAPSTTLAQSAEDVLAMCKRDANNTLRRMKADIQSGIGSLRTLEATCIQGPKAEQIKGLAGYAEVQKLHQEAKALLQAAESRAAADESAARASALGAGPGGDAGAIRARWNARPARCQEAGEWDKAAGAARGKPGGTARIAGLEEAEGPPKIHPRVFAGLDSSGRWPGDFRADDHLARIACGKGVEGIDPFFNPNRDLAGRQFLENDPRAALAGALEAGAGDEARRVLYRAALVHECFQATAWDLKKDYEAYLFCADNAGAPPTEAELDKALAAVFPGRDHERDNLRFLLGRATQAQREVDAAFQKMEAKYPRMRTIYRDSAQAARQRWEERRKRYVAAYRVLDPLTARLLEDPESAPPEGCEAELLKLREMLAEEIAPRDAAGVRALRVEHPLGYQITEALAYCHLGRGRLAKARLEADLLRGLNRRITLGEELFYARLDALQALVRELKTEEKILAAVPNYRPHGVGSPLPGSLQRKPLFYEAIDRKGSFETLGESAKKPAVVAEKKAGVDGVQLVFKKFTYTHKYRDTQCKETDRVERYEVRSEANGATSVKPIYHMNCWPVGPVKSEPITHQEKPALLPREDAEGVEPGQQVIVLVNTRVKGDSALVDCWDPKAGRDKASVVQGVRVR